MSEDPCGHKIGDPTVVELRKGPNVIYTDRSFRIYSWDLGTWNFIGILTMVYHKFVD